MPTACGRSRRCEYAATAGLLVVDAKRGDIGHTARAYACRYLEPRNGSAPLADALTVNTYLGRDSLEPFVASCRRSGGGVFCLVNASNPGGTDIQDLTLPDGNQVWQHVAKLVAELSEDVVGECGLSSIGAIVGATYAGGQRGQEAVAAVHPAAAGDRSAGRDARRRRESIHERAGERARRRLALRHLRLPPSRATTGGRRGRRGRPPGAKCGLPGLVDRRRVARIAAPLAFLAP